MSTASRASAAPLPCCCLKVCDVPKVNDVITYTAEGYANSETVGRADGCTVFVPRLIVGEVAQVRIDYVKKNVAYATPVRIIKPSSARISPPCDSFGKCGGCTLAHIAYDKQLVFKQNKVANNLRKVGKLDVNVLPCVPSPRIWGYRNKLSLPVRGKRGAVKAGMFERNSHNVVETTRCPLGGDWAAELTSIFTSYCNDVGVEPYDERDFSGVARHLTARFVDGQLLATVVSNGEFNYDLRPLARALSDRFDRFGLFVNVNTARNNVILGKETRHICGLRYIEGEHLGVKFRLRPDSFFQINDDVKDLVYAKAKELLDTSQTQVLVDCFSGIGILTNVLASERFDSYAIEIEPSAVRDANDLARLNNTPRLTNVCGDVATELPKIVASNLDKRFTIVVDPPRKGWNENICNTLKQAAPNSIVYISCDSATLARDLSMLSDMYDISYVEPYDMFPQTDQVETLVVLSHKKPDGHIGVKVEFGEGEGQISLKEIKKRAEKRKPKEKVTYKMIQEYIEKTYGFKVHTAYIAEVKRSLGLPMYDAPNAVEELKRPRSHPSPQMVEAIKETLKHFEII